MMFRRKILIIGAGFLLAIGIVFAVNFTPQGNIDLKNYYNITNLAYIFGFTMGGDIIGNSNSITGLSDLNSTRIYQNGNQVLDTSSNINGSKIDALDWTKLQNYPAACPAGSYLTQLDDSVTCTTPSEFRLDSWDNFTGIPKATPSNGDTTHLSTADQIYDWVTGLGYITDGNTNWDNSYGFITNTVSDLTNYYTKTIIDSLGNWSADKGDYYTSTQANSNFINVNGDTATAGSTFDWAGSNFTNVGKLNVTGDLISDTIHKTSSEGLVLGMNFNSETVEGTAGSETVLDSSGYNNHGTNNGATHNLTNGFNGGGAFEFDGIDDKITMSTENYINDSATWSFWIKKPVNQEGKPIISKYNTVGDQRSWSIGTNPKDGGTGIIVYLSGDGTLGFNQVISGSTFPVDEWTHFVLTYDGTTLRTWKNNVELTSYTANVPATLYQCTAPTEIGYAYLGKQTYFKGSIDDVRIYNRALTEDEIKALYLQRAEVHNSYVSQKDVQVDSDGNVEVTGNVIAENVYLPAYIFQHTNSTIPVNSAGVWENITFDAHAAGIASGISHNYNNNTNDTFTINVAGIYKINYGFVVRDSASNPDSNVVFRLIKNGNEIHGSSKEIDLSKQNEDRTSSSFAYANLSVGDKIKLQFTSDDTTVSLGSGCTYGDHCTSAIIGIRRIS